MKFFQSHKIVKNYTMFGVPFNVVNLTHRIDSLTLQKNDENFFTKYTVKDGDTPHSIADKVYDDVNLFYLVMLMNDMYDIDRDWPMSTNSLERYIKRNYDDPDAIHHYESAATGAVVDANHVAYDRVPVTNREYEYRRNDSKREIKILLPRFVNDVTKGL